MAIDNEERKRILRFFFVYQSALIVGGIALGLIIYALFPIWLGVTIAFTVAAVCCVVGLYAYLRIRHRLRATRE